MHSTDHLTEARELLYEPDGQPTRTYQAYLDCEQGFQSARRAYDTALAEAQHDPRSLQDWPIAGQPYRHAVDQAWDRWAALGHKREIDAALAVLATNRQPDAQSGPDWSPSDSTC